MAQSKIEKIDQILSALKGSDKIPASRLKGWLRRPSLKILDGVAQLVAEQPWRVDPPLPLEEVCTIVQEYFRQCLIRDMNTDYAPPRSIAGFELVFWFRKLWRDPAVPREYLIRIKGMLFDLCVQNIIPQDEFVGAVLEHLFEMPEVQEFFADWKSDPRLSEAFARAKEWGDEHTAWAG